MDKPLILIGYRYSVYTRIVRMALIEMGLSAEYVEVNPFSDPSDPELAAHSAFGRVPVLRHGDFTLTETAAILRYLDAIGPGLSLVPTAAQPAARMAQIIGIVDAYAYWPLVRDVFGAAFFAPHQGQPVDLARIATGLSNAQPSLQTLNAIADEGLQLDGADITLADLHLAPMIAYFSMADEGAAALARYPALLSWWAAVRNRSSLQQTDPFARR